MSAITATTDTHAITSAIKPRSVETRFAQEDALTATMVVLPIIACVAAVSLGLSIAVHLDVLHAASKTVLFVQAFLATYALILTTPLVIWIAYCCFYLSEDDPSGRYAPSIIVISLYRSNPAVVQSHPFSQNSASQNTLTAIKKDLDGATGPLPAFCRGLERGQSLPVQTSFDPAASVSPPSVCTSSMKRSASSPDLLGIFGSHRRDEAAVIGRDSAASHRPPQATLPSNPTEPKNSVVAIEIIPRIVALIDETIRDALDGVCEGARESNQPLVFSSLVELDKDSADFDEELKRLSIAFDTLDGVELRAEVEVNVPPCPPLLPIIVVTDVDDEDDRLLFAPLAHCDSGTLVDAAESVGKKFKTD